MVIASILNGRISASFLPEKGVIAHDLTTGIPFPDQCFEMVYHSHVLEHFSKATALPFLQECYRVLSPRGVIRIAVPDLEQIVRSYLLALEQAQAGSQEWAINYEWLLLEMYDQTVRNRSGGEMAGYLSQPTLPNRAYVIERLGAEARKIIESSERRREQIISQPTASRLLKFAKRGYRLVRYPEYRREQFLQRILGEEYETLQLGRFRQSGETHQWMYDEYSLKRLLQLCGLEQILRRSATESYVDNWSRFHLDTEADSTIYKPDSLYMEALKPA